jgi:ornithine carbamoyltransferase
MSAMVAPHKHFLQFKDFSRDELQHLFARTRVIKERFKPTSLTTPWRIAPWR